MGTLNRKHHEDSRLLKKVLKAITEQCLECSGGNALERKFCKCECELWPYRFGCNPAHANPALLDRKNFADGAIFGSDKEATKCEEAAKRLATGSGKAILADRD